MVALSSRSLGTCSAPLRLGIMEICRRFCLATRVHHVTDAHHAKAFMTHDRKISILDVVSILSKQESSWWLISATAYRITCVTSFIFVSRIDLTRYQSETTEVRARLLDQILSSTASYHNDASVDPFTGFAAKLLFCLCVCRSKSTIATSDSTC
jgi:hypothetical protein